MFGFMVFDVMSLILLTKTGKQPHIRIEGTNAYSKMWSFVDFYRQNIKLGVKCKNPRTTLFDSAALTH